MIVLDTSGSSTYVVLYPNSLDWLLYHFYHGHWLMIASGLDGKKYVYFCRKRRVGAFGTWSTVQWSERFVCSQCFVDHPLFCLLIQVSELVDDLTTRLAKFNIKPQRSVLSKLAELCVLFTVFEANFNRPLHSSPHEFFIFKVKLL